MPIAPSGKTLIRPKANSAASSKPNAVSRTYTPRVENGRRSTSFRPRHQARMAERNCASAANCARAASTVACISTKAKPPTSRAMFPALSAADSSTACSALPSDQDIMPAIAARARPIGNTDQSIRRNMRPYSPRPVCNKAEKPSGRGERAATTLMPVSHGESRAVTTRPSRKPLLSV